ncbi:MAG: penicillin-binding protein 2 [bacterium]
MKTPFSSIQSVFPNFLSKDGDEEYFLPEKEEDVVLNDTLYPGGENAVLRKEVLRGLNRLPYYYALVTIGICLLLGRAWQLQVLRSRQFALQAEGHRVTSVPVSSTRGILYDRNKRELVKNLPTFSVYIVQSSLPQSKVERFEVYRKLGELLQPSISPEVIEQIVNAADLPPLTPILIQAKIDRSVALLIEAYKLSLSGVLVKSGGLREYKNVVNDQKVLSLSHLLGYVGSVTQDDLKDYPDYEITDSLGKVGLEAKYETQLRGVTDFQQMEVDNVGMPVKLLKKANPIPGKNLTLTIDLLLQQKVETVLKKYIDQAEKKMHSGEGAGVAILQNPKNGEILAMVSLPSYDNNQFAKGISQADFQKLMEPSAKKPLFNRAVTGVYPPGSVFKPFVASAALQEGNITASTQIEDVGFFKVFETIYSNWYWTQSHGVDGWITVEEALERSNDIFFYNLAGYTDYNKRSGIGSDNVAQYAKMFGFEKKTGIDLPGEAIGTIPSQTSMQSEGLQWRQGDTYLMSIGQGYDLASPLQIVNATSAVANGGTLFKPHLLKEMSSFNGSDVQTIQPEVLNQNFINAKHLATVRRGMSLVTQNTQGTAYSSFRGFSVKVAGKTGTAQYEGNKKEHAWFTAFAPYDNPEISLVVLVEGGGEGSQVSAPAAREILEYYFGDYQRDKATVNAKTN